MLRLSICKCGTDVYRWVLIAYACVCPRLYCRVAEVGRLEDENVVLRKMVSELRGGGRGQGGVAIKVEEELHCLPNGVKQVRADFITQ